MQLTLSKEKVKFHFRSEDFNKGFCNMVLLFFTIASLRHFSCPFSASSSHQIQFSGGIWSRELLWSGVHSQIITPTSE
jgi:hypothetical protein